MDVGYRKGDKKAGGIHLPPFVITMDFSRPREDTISETYLYKMASIAELKLLARNLHIYIPGTDIN